MKQLEVAKDFLSKESSDSIRSELRTFNLALDISFPKSFVQPKELIESHTVMNYLQVDYLNGSIEKEHKADLKKDDLIKNASPLNFEISLGRLNEWGLRSVNYSAEKNQLKIQITGSIRSANPNQTFDVKKKYPLQMNLNIPGFKKRKMVIPIQPGYTTFLDLQLD